MVSSDELPHEPFSGFLYAARKLLTYTHYLLIQDGRQGRRVHMRKILLRLLRIFISLTSVEYRSKTNILGAS